MVLLFSAEPRRQQAFIPLTVSLWNDLADPVFDGEGLAGFKSRTNAFLLSQAARSHFVFYCFPFLLFRSLCWYCDLWGWGRWTDRISSTLSRHCIYYFFKTIITVIIIIITFYIKIV